MNSMHRIPLVGIALGLLVAAGDAYAVRYAERPLLWRRTAVSGYVGQGYPVGVFASDDLPGDGNHAEWPIDWAVEIEHFAGPTWSLGFSAARTTYEDNTVPDLETNVQTYSGFLRIVVPTGSAVRPYLRFGMGGMQIEFEQTGEYRFDADYAFSFQAGAGLMWLPVRWLGLNAQALYYHGSTEDSYLDPEAAEYFELDTVPVVGFDTTYFAFSGGISLFFP
jgi:hypothetical protein